MYWLERTLDWFLKLTTPRKVSLLCLMIILTLWAGGTREARRHNDAIIAVDKRVYELQTQMREEMRASSELHGRIQQRLERIEKQIDELRSK